MNKEIIKEYFKDKMNSPSTLTKYVKSMDKEMRDYLENILKQIPQYQDLNKLICAIINNIDLRRCEYCGQYLTYEQTKRGKIYCSRKCKENDPKIKQKIKQTCIQKYGTKAPTCNQNILYKRQMNNLKKYGVKNTLLIPEIRQKIKQTCIQKYGGNAPACNYKIREKMNKTFYNKTGIEHNQILKGYQHILSFNNYVIPLFLINEYQGLRSRKIYKWKCSKCNKQFESPIPYTNFKDLPQYCPHCPDCYPEIIGQSQLEKQILEFIKSIYNGNIFQNDRTIIKPLELNIVLPKLKLAIQFNGSYWHSNKQDRIDQNYHLNKTLLCQKNGYRLIHIFEYEWMNKQQIIKNKLKSIICNNLDSIYARKCIVKQISVKQKNQFLNNNHIQGTDNSSIKLGLYFNQQLIAVMTFNKPRFNKNFEWQLSRYATSKRVIGGAGKLLKYFQNTYKPKSIITYADKRFSIGNMYQKIGFKLDHISKPNYVWIKDNQILSRYQTQKHKLKKLLGDKFDQNLSESMNMMINSYKKIYDCGNLVYIKILF